MAKKTQTFLDVQRQIEKLKADAEKLRMQEKGGVVARIKHAIEAYGLTPADLFGSEANTARTAKTAATKTAKVKAKSKAYADGNGNVWGGRGPRPAWLRDALAAGRKLEDLVQGAAKTEPAAADAAASNGDATDKPVATKAAKAEKKAGMETKKPAVKVEPKYRDDKGNTWSGRGMKPRWLQAAITSGAQLTDFAI